MEDKINIFKNSKEWKDFIDYYDGITVCRQLGLFRYEDTHVNFFASLFDKKDYYGYGNYPVRLLLELIKSKSNDKYLNDMDLSSNYDVLDVEPFLHKSFGKGCIPDFVLKFDIKFENDKVKKYAVLIEAKFISSYESKYQCEKYYNVLEDYEDYKDREKIYLFLSLESKPMLSFSKIDVNDIFLKISYQELIDYVYDPCILNTKKDVTFSVREYVKCFNDIYDYSISNDMIPLSTDGKNLTLSVWNSHSEFFEFIFSNLNNSVVSDFYRDYSKILRILFINLKKIQCIDNENVKRNVNLIADNVKKSNVFVNSYTNEPEFYSNKDFVLRLIRDLNEYHFEEMEVINVSAFSGYPLFITDKEFKSKTKGNGQSYYWEDIYNASLLGLDGSEEYHIIYLNNDEINTLIDTVINTIPVYKNRIYRISNDIKELIKLSN